MKIAVVGAGAMGGSYGGLLALSGHEVGLIDAWQAHVDAINRDGLKGNLAAGELPRSLRICVYRFVQEGLSPRRLRAGPRLRSGRRW